MKYINYIKKYKIQILLFIVLLLLCTYIFQNECIEGFTLDIEKDTTMDERSEKYELLMDDFDSIFPDRNRNAGGPQFFKHIVDMNLSKHDFELYNSFYCGVSGSPVDPKRGKVSDYVIVKNLNDEEIYGKYYRCCWPCLCDIMKYARVDKYDIELYGSMVTYDVLTIEDPCCDESKIPNSVSSYKCENGKTQNGVYSRNGRLIFALFYDTKVATESDDISDVLERCSERMDTRPDDLRGGMGDIFVKLSLACKQNKKDIKLKNIYGEPLKKCKQIFHKKNEGSWDDEGYCSERGGGVHQICFSVDDDTANFSKQTGQSEWSTARVGNNHCMCLGAWALYKAKQDKGDIKDKTNNELVCESIPEMALDSKYINKWNTWNGNELPEQISNGVDSLYQQCYAKANNSQKKFLKDKYTLLKNIITNMPDEDYE